MIEGHTIFNKIHKFDCTKVFYLQPFMAYCSQPTLISHSFINIGSITMLLYIDVVFIDPSLIISMIQIFQLISSVEYDKQEIYEWVIEILFVHARAFVVNSQSV